VLDSLFACAAARSDRLYPLASSRKQGCRASCCVQSPWRADRLRDPLGGDGGFGAAVAAAAAGLGVGPGAPVFLLEELDEDSLCVGRAGGGAERGDDCVLLAAVEDAVDEDGEVGAQEREVDAEFAESAGSVGL
jgi:hypothetical protein